MEKLIYLDNAATTALKPEVLEKMMPYLKENYSNPSSIYSFAQKANKAVNDARSTIAGILGAKEREIYFTSGGSEGDNWAIKGAADLLKEKGKHIITSQIEHPAVLHTCQVLEKQGFEITYLKVNKNGFIDIEELRNSIRNDTILITIMFANNEIGTIQPIEMVAKIAKMYNILFHTDAVQACGNIPIDVKRMGIDALSLSGHKLYAPKGIGVLYIRRGCPFNPFFLGGHQEDDYRAGTENVAGIVGMGKAIELAYENIEEYNKKLIELREYCIEKLQSKIGKIKINGARKDRLPGNINISFLGEDSSDLLLKLDEKGICTSAGSACNTGASSPSHVLMAIGLNNEEAEGALRITLGKENTKEDIDYLVNNIVDIFK